MKFLLTLSIICCFYTLLAHASVDRVRMAKPVTNQNNKGGGGPQAHAPIHSEPTTAKASLRIEDLIHMLLFQGEQNVTSILNAIETNDAVCDGKETFYNWDVMPLNIRLSFLKKLIKNDPNIELDLAAPTNWASLTTEVQSLLTALLSAGGKFNLPIKLSTCLSRSKLEATLCTNLSKFIDAYLQSQLTGVPSNNKI